MQRITAYRLFRVSGFLGLASGFGVLLILLGGLIMAVSYRFVSQCSLMFRYTNCWDPFLYGGDASGFYVGATFTISGIIILLGEGVARQLRKLRGARLDSER